MKKSRPIERNTEIEILTYPSLEKLMDNNFFRTVEWIKFINKFDVSRYHWRRVEESEYYNMSSKESIDKYLKDIEDDEKYRCLRIIYDKAYFGGGNIFLINNIKTEMSRYKVFYIDRRIRSEIKENNEVESLKMTEEDYEEYSKISMSVSMLVDMFECQIKNINDILIKYSAKDASYNDIYDLCVKLRKASLTFHKYSDVKFDELFGDECDKLLELLNNKSKQMIKKWKQKSKNAEKQDKKRYE